MELSEAKLNELTHKILNARMALLTNHGFYGLLLMNMKIGLREGCDTACTDCCGHIWFGPEFLDTLDLRAVQFVLMHEIGHSVFRFTERVGEYNWEGFNIAQDIVINSNILLANNGDLQSISIPGFGPSMHSVRGYEGYELTTEQVYDMLPRYTITWDDHSLLPSDKEGEDSSTEKERAEWLQHFKNTCQNLENRCRYGSAINNQIPSFAKRLLDQLSQTKHDWRRLLAEFVQDDGLDYAFNPPDRRYSESGFFLPDLNEALPGRVEKILFMIDTSASMSQQQVTTAFSEIKGAIEQFGGRLQGYLGFFDNAVIPPKPFEDVSSLMDIEPAGFGGTRFDIIFQYVSEHMKDDLPACIIILTDGFADYPEEAAAMGIPTMWLILQQSTFRNTFHLPPWGRVLTIEEN